MKRLLVRGFMAALVLLGLGLSGVMCARVAERGRYATAYSTYSAGPEGARALYELARRAGHPTQRWVEDLERLPEGGVLVALGGCLAPQRRPLSPYEEERLLAWVRRGGTLMVFGAEQYLPSAYPVHLTRPRDQCAHEPLERVLRAIAGSAVPRDVPEEPEEGADVGDEASASGELRAEVERDHAVFANGSPDLVYLARTQEGPLLALGGVPMQTPATLHVADAAPATVLAAFGQRPAALALREGEGVLVVVASASMLLNGMVAEHRGGMLFTRLLTAYARPGAALIFDEYHLGAGGARSLVRYLRQIGAGVVLAQLLFVLALWVSRSGRRLGELEEPPPEPPGGTVSYVAATSALYSRSADRAGIAQVLLRRALERIAHHHRVRAKEPHDLVQQLRAMGREDAANACADALSLSSAPVANERELVGRSLRIDELVLRATAPRAVDVNTPLATRGRSLPPPSEASPS